MANNIGKLAESLGARIVGQVRDVGGGAFGAAQLGKIVIDSPAKNLTNQPKSSKK